MLTPNVKRPSNGHLPEDVMVEILLRLPVKTLLRFKCVCKHWYDLIRSKSFVNQHFGHESNQERLLIRHYRPNMEGYAFVLYVDEMLTVYEEPNHLQMHEGVAALMGPLNGVFCVVNKSGQVALLNPVMRQFKPLPSHHLNVQPRSFLYDYMFGFGLDPMSGDYKLVVIQYSWRTRMNVSIDPPLVFVYNSGSDSWRHLGDLDLLNSMHWAENSVCNTYLNGVYYWLVGLKAADAAILAFDMSSENFQEIQVPDCVELKERNLVLVPYCDSLALLSYDSEKFDECVDVWVMRKEGCWTKGSTLGPLQYVGMPLGFWKNNVLLLHRDTKLLTLYDVSTKKLRDVEAWGDKTSYWGYWVFSYKESLVSIKGDGDDCKLWDTSSAFVKDFFG